MDGGNIYSDEYEFSTHFAHRRPASLIRPPAITRHLAFRRMGGLSEVEWFKRVELVILKALHASVAASSSGVRVSNLHDEDLLVDSKGDAVINLLHHKYKFDGSREFSADEYEGKGGRNSVNGRYAVVVMAGIWCGKDFWARFEVFEEYYTLTSCLMIDVGALSREIDAPENSMGRIIGGCADRFRRICLDNGIGRVFSDEKLIADSRNLFYGAWRNFSSEVLGGALSGERSAFADFRSLILAFPDRLKGSSAGLFSLNGLSPPLPYPELTLMDHSPEREVDSLRWVEALFPVLLGGRREKVAQDIDGDHLNRIRNFFEDVEYSFSFLEDSRYLHGSCFGEVASDSEIFQKRIPTSVTLCFHDDWRQIGRVIMRLHAMSTLALFALFDVAKFMERDQKLLELESELDFFHKTSDARQDIRLADERRTVRERRSAWLDELELLLDGSLKSMDLHWPVTDKDKGAYSSYADLIRSFKTHKMLRSRSFWFFEAFRRNWHGIRLKAVLVRVVEVLCKIQGRLNSQQVLDAKEALRCCEGFIKSSDLDSYQDVLLHHVRSSLSSMEHDASDGITYRASRSRYARDLFSSLADAMQIRQISGYQPYHVSIRHRLDRAYGLIEAVGVRFRQVSMREERLRQYVLSARSVSLQAIVSKLQISAETAFWVVLAPYYLSHTAVMVAESLESDHKHSETAGVVVGGLVIFGYALHVFRGLYLRYFTSKSRY